jgi:hypothetical protein
MQESDGLPRREQMTEEEWERETYKAVITAITALERVMHFGGLVTVPNLHNALIYLRAKRDRMEKQMRIIAYNASERSFES